MLRGRALFRLGERGDTIVEVLIVVMVLSVVFVTSYSLATRSQKTNLQVQEQTQALKLAEGQLESLKAFDEASLPAAGSKFCFNSTGGVVSLSSSTLSPNLDSDNFSSYSASCRYVPEGVSCTSYCYYFGITRGTGSNSNLYTAIVRWDGVNGRRNEVKLWYKLS